MEFQDFLNLLENVRPSGQGYQARCPAHDDRNPSLSVTEGDDGQILVHCHTGCTSDDVVKAMGRKMSDLYNQSETFGRSRVSKRSEYKRESSPDPIPEDMVEKLHNALTPDDRASLSSERMLSDAVIDRYQLGIVEENDKRRISIPILDEKGAIRNIRLWLSPDQRKAEEAIAKMKSWKAGYGETRLFPADQLECDELVFCEGELDALALISQNIPAITLTNGAEMVPDEEAVKRFKGKVVTLLMDNDDTGRKGASKRAAALVPSVQEIKIASWPEDRSEKWDVTDELKKHGTDSLRVILNDSVSYEPIEIDENTPLIASVPSANLTDMGNAQRLVEQFGSDMYYCYEWRKFLTWDGQRWGPDRGNRIMQIAKETVRSIYAEAGQEADESERKKIADHAKSSESRVRLEAMIKLTESELPITTDKLDSDPWLLNVVNGTLDLRTGELKDSRRGDLITKLAPVEYDPEAVCPLWEEFLQRVMDGNRSLIEFLQRAVGYSLTGLTREQVFFLLYGLGANGKSVFLTILQTLLGDYAQQSDFSTFLERQGDGPRNDIARLKGARFVAATEAERGRPLSETVIKQLTGGDRVTARFLHQEHFEYDPQYKIWLAANHKPDIRGTDEAIWRRTRLIPFTVTIPESEREPDLPIKLKDELPGILAWAVQGCLAWQEQGLGVPDAVKAATAAYRDEMDILADFLDECCVMEPNAVEGATALYQAYSQWCEHSGSQPVKQKTFGMRLSERGIERDKINGKIVRIGVRFQSDETASVRTYGQSGRLLTFSQRNIPHEGNYPENGPDGPIVRTEDARDVEMVEGSV